MSEIPPSLYPVLRDPMPAKRTIVGPWIASKPAYQMFAEMAAGKSLSDIIADDQRAQAKAEGRPDPVFEHPENAKFWAQGGGSGDHDTTDSPPASTPGTAPPAPTTLPPPLTVGPLPLPPRVALPVPAAPAATGSSTPPLSAPEVAAPASIPAEAASAVAPLVKTADLGARRLPVAFLARGASRPTESADTQERRDAAAARGARPQPPSVIRQIAQTSYTKGSRQARVVARFASRRPTPNVT